jgi:hypothetical protein
MPLSFVFSQQRAQLVYSFPISDESAWHADLLGNLYIGNKDILVKFDTADVKQYSQSIKSLERIRQISSINTMKIVLFSDQQQTITLFDNTLSEANKTYDLSELGFGFVAQIAVSSQPNKFWIYDQSEAKLVLLDMSRTAQQQEIENVRGILNSGEIVWMKEDNNVLYLLDNNHRLFSFDAYGTLLDVITLSDEKGVEVIHDQIFVLKEEGIFRYRQEDKTYEKVNIEWNGIKDFQWVDNHFFVRVNGVVLKYEI